MAKQKGKWNNSEKAQRLRTYRPFRDNDADGVPNFSDCQPLNPYEHGFWSNIITRVRSVIRAPIQRVQRAGQQAMVSRRQTVRSSVQARTSTRGRVSYSRKRVTYTDRGTRIAKKYVPRVVRKAVKKISKIGAATRLKVIKKPERVPSGFKRGIKPRTALAIPRGRIKPITKVREMLSAITRRGEQKPRIITPKTIPIASLRHIKAKVEMAKVALRERVSRIPRHPTIAKFIEFEKRTSPGYIAARAIKEKVPPVVKKVIAFKRPLKAKYEAKERGWGKRLTPITSFIEESVAYAETPEVKKEIETTYGGYRRLFGLPSKPFEIERKAVILESEYKRGIVEGVSEKPLKTAVTTAAFFVLPPALKAGGWALKAARVTPTIAKIPTVGKPLVKGFMPAIGVALGGAYAVGTGIHLRETPPELRVREFGKITGTELAPMAIGSYAALKSPLKMGVARISKDITWKGIVWDRPGKPFRPIIGIKGKDVFVGEPLRMRGFDIPKLIPEGIGFKVKIPHGGFEGAGAIRGAKVPAEVWLSKEAGIEMRSAIEIMQKFAATKPQIRRPLREAYVEYIPTRALIKIEKVIQSVEHVIYGSVVPEMFLKKPPKRAHDIDLGLRKKDMPVVREKITGILQEVYGKSNVRKAPKGEGIEVRHKEGEWHHAVDIHPLEWQEAFHQVPAFGVKVRPWETVEGIRTISLGEQWVKKGTTWLAPEYAQRGGQLGLKSEWRLKDISGWSQISRDIEKSALYRAEKAFLLKKHEVKKATTLSEELKAIRAAEITKYPQIEAFMGGVPYAGYTTKPYMYLREFPYTTSKVPPIRIYPPITRYPDAPMYPPTHPPAYPPKYPPTYKEPPYYPTSYPPKYPPKYPPRYKEPPYYPPSYPPKYPPKYPPVYKEPPYTPPPPPLLPPDEEPPFYPPYSPPPFLPPAITPKERVQKKAKPKKKKAWEWLEEFTVQRPEELHFGAIESGIPKVSKVTMLPTLTMADITPNPKQRKAKSLKGSKSNRRSKKKK